MSRRLVFFIFLVIFVISLHSIQFHIYNRTKQKLDAISNYKLGNFTEVLKSTKSGQIRTLTPSVDLDLHSSINEHIEEITNTPQPKVKIEVFQESIENESPSEDSSYNNAFATTHIPLLDEDINLHPQNQTNREIVSHLFRRRTHRFGTIATWESTLHFFAEHNQIPNNPRGTVFYLKRGTTGISGQLVGICDSYFVALATGKSLQFSSGVVTDEFFEFGLPNMYVPLNQTQRKQAYTYNPFHQELKEWDKVITAMDSPDPLQRPLAQLKEYSNILFSTLHVTADRVFRIKNNRGVMLKMGMIPNKKSPAPTGRGELYSMVDVYYNRCIRSLFRPSAKLQPILQKYEKMLGDGVRIGVHIRMGKGMSDWKDSHTFLNHNQVADFMTRLKEMIETIEKKHPELPVKIFLSTDSSKEEKLMKKQFGEYIVTTEGLRSHVGGIYFTSFDDLSIQKAILDQMLLGKCDYLFLTMKSGFSRIGLFYTPEGTPYKYIWGVC